MKRKNISNFDEYAKTQLKKDSADREKDTDAVQEPELSESLKKEYEFEEKYKKEREKK